jgi:hypothetical protein
MQQNDQLWTNPCRRKHHHHEHHDHHTVMLFLLIQEKKVKYKINLQYYNNLPYQQ